MKKIIIYIVLSIMGVGIAQVKELKIQKSDSTTIQLKDELDKELKEKNQETLLHEEILALRNENSQLRKEKKQLEGILGKKTDESKEIQEKYNKLISNLKLLDNIVYARCLLYPLEIKYNKVAIEKMKDIVNDFSIKLGKSTSEKFNDIKKTYFPLLEDYKKYNDELLIYFQGLKKPFEMKKGNLSDADVLKYSKNIKMLKYYNKYYTKRSDYPYQSIIYLDNIVDEYFSMLKKKNGVDKEIKGLIEKLASISQEIDIKEK